MKHRDSVKTVLCAASVAAATWAAFSTPVFARQHTSPSSSASVGRLSNTSSSGNIYSAYYKDYDTGAIYYYNAINTASLMITDVNDDGHQDIKVIVTVPPLGALSGLMHGFLIVDGASGAPVTNEVYSQG